LKMLSKQLLRGVARSTSALTQRAFHATPVVAKKGDISAAELSSILTEKMSAASDDVSIDEVGKVLNIGDGIARVYGLRSVQAGEMVEFPGAIKGMASTWRTTTWVLSSSVMTVRSRRETP